MNLPWLRLYCEFATDPVIQSLAFEDQRHYVVLLCIKGTGLIDRGISWPAKERLIIRALGLDSATAAEVKRRLREVGLISEKWQIKGWEKRQFDSDHSTERTRKYRKNKKHGNGIETPDRRHGDGPEQNRTEQSPKSQNHGGENPSANRPRATALPNDFSVTDEMLAWAQTTYPLVNLKIETERFKDWAISKGATYKRWDAAWRNWMRKADEYRKKNGKGSDTPDMLRGLR